MAIKFLLECKEYKFITLRPLEIVVLILGKLSLISSGRNDFLKEKPGGSSIDSDFTTWYIFRKKHEIYFKVSQDVHIFLGDILNFAASKLYFAFSAIQPLLLIRLQVGNA